MPKHYLKEIIGQLKSDIVKNLKDDYIEFGYWIYIPKFKILLSFKRQVCESLEMI